MRRDSIRHEEVVVGTHYGRGDSALVGLVYPCHTDLPTFHYEHLPYYDLCDVDTDMGEGAAYWKGHLMYTKILYVSSPLRVRDGIYGPFTPYLLERNTRIASHLAKLGWRAGWAVICPHLNTYQFDGLPGVSSEAIISGDLTFLDRLAAGQDAVLFGPHWNDSEGCAKERERAVERGLYVAGSDMFDNRDDTIMGFLEALRISYGEADIFIDRMTKEQPA